jgi:DNA (cytosine-5)-methyltransferase 1
MRYGSVCSGVEAATVAWHPLGWEPQWFSEIEKFPSAVLQHHYPDVPNYGDMTKFKEWPNDRSIELLVGGTPCQSFSVAGLRKGLDDPRGNLMLTYLAIAAQHRPRWLVWENVPGVLSSNRGRDFGTFIGALGKLGYGFAYRVLDAQYAGVAQRRRRVFVVAHSGDWRCAAAVLFERESLQGHPPPSRETREEVAGAIASSSFVGGAGGRPEGAAVNHFVPIGNVQDGSITSLSSREYKGLSCGRDGMTSAAVVAFPAELSVTHKTAVTYGIPGNWIGRAPENGGNATKSMDNIAPNLTSADRHAVAFSAGQSSKAGSLGLRVEQSPTLRGGASGTNMTPTLLKNMQVRRLTPRECERLQGFSDDYTRIPWRNKAPEDCPDGPRYKAMGNSMAVPVMRWIGERIAMVDKL